MTVAGTWGPAADQMFVSDRRDGDRDGYLGCHSRCCSTVLAEVGHRRSPVRVMVVRGWVATVDDPAAAPADGPRFD